jgi:hypothetical protein
VFSTGQIMRPYRRDGTPLRSVRLVGFGIDSRHGRREASGDLASAFGVWCWRGPRRASRERSGKSERA